jgi:predicted transcriptional regulator
MSRKPANHVKIMFCLSPALAKAFRRVAAERKQTNSVVAEEFLQDGVTKHDARKVEK